MKVFYLTILVFLLALITIGCEMNTVSPPVADSSDSKFISSDSKINSSNSSIATTDLSAEEIAKHYTTGYFTDTRDSTQYKWVQYENIRWMAENLRYKHTDSLEEYCFRGDVRYCETYGVSYLGSEVLDSYHGNNSLCPDGWRVPTNDDFMTLGHFVANLIGKTTMGCYGEQVISFCEIAPYLRAKESWGDNNGNDLFAFSLLASHEHPAPGIVWIIGPELANTFDPPYEHDYSQGSLWSINQTQSEPCLNLWSSMTRPGDVGNYGYNPICSNLSRQVPLRCIKEME